MNVLTLELAKNMHALDCIVPALLNRPTHVNSRHFTTNCWQKCTFFILYVDTIVWTSVINHVMERVVVEFYRIIRHSATRVFCFQVHLLWPLALCWCVAWSHVWCCIASLEVTDVLWIAWHLVCMRRCILLLGCFVHNLMRPWAIYVTVVLNVCVVAQFAPRGTVESFRGQCDVVLLFLTFVSRLSHCSGPGDIILSVQRLKIDWVLLTFTHTHSFFLSYCFFLSASLFTPLSECIGAFVFTLEAQTLGELTLSPFIPK